MASWMCCCHLYLDVQNVSIGSSHKEQQLELLLSRQVSKDSSRVVLFVFVGYLLPNLASTSGFWTSIAALLTSLSTHIATELYVAIHSRGSDKGKEVKGQSGFWLIASDLVLLQSFYLFSHFIVRAIISGRFIRDNLASRIPLALESPFVESTFDTCRSEMLKSWIVARVCQPDYVFNRSGSSLGLVCVVTYIVVFMGAKVIFLSSHEPGPSPLFTTQWIFIIVGWFVVFYRHMMNRVQIDIAPNPIDLTLFGPYFSTIIVLSNKIENIVVQAMVGRGISLFYRLFSCIYILGLMACSALCLVFVLLIFALVAYPAGCMLTLIERYCSAPPGDDDEDFPRYSEALEQVCMHADDAKSLWTVNKSSFCHMRKCIDKAYERGKSCEILHNVIGSFIAQNFHSNQDLNEILEPLESVRRYFPLLKHSFKKTTALVLLMDDDSVSEAEQQSNIPALRRSVRAALKAAEKLMDFHDCPDNVGISFDVFNIPNLEAFTVAASSNLHVKRVRFNFRESPTVANAVDKLFKEAKVKLETYKLVGDVNQLAVVTEWEYTAEAYVEYKICKTIKDHPAEASSVERLQNYLINMAADLIAMCVTESPKILVELSRKWAAEFKEHKIASAIELLGFACGVIDGARERHPQLPV